MIYFFQSLSLKIRFLAVLLLLFPVLAFQGFLTQAPWALARLKAVSHGTGLPDGWLWYSPDTLHQVLAAWGETGRSVYWTALWPTDLGFLLSYGAFLGAAVLYLLKKANPAHSWWYLTPLLPAASAAADFLENVCVGAAAWLPSHGWDLVAVVAGAMTTLKWLLLAITLGLLVAGTVVTWVRGVLRRLA